VYNIRKIERDIYSIQEDIHGILVAILNIEGRTRIYCKKKDEKMIMYVESGINASYEFIESIFNNPLYWYIFVVMSLIGVFGYLMFRNKKKELRRDGKDIVKRTI